MAADHMPIEQTEMFGHYVAVANWAWKAANSWKPFARDTVGIQLVRAGDSVGANLVEGDGRYANADSLRFFVVARASARETRYWIQRCLDRDLVAVETTTEILDRLVRATQMLNALIRYRRDRSNHTVREACTPYCVDVDPFNCDLDVDAEIIDLEAKYYARA